METTSLLLITGSVALASVGLYAGLQCLSAVLQAMNE